MAFNTPTLPQLVQRGDADLTAKSIDSLRRSDQVVLARMHAGATSGLHGHVKWGVDQILPDTCDEDMLLRIAKLRLKTPRGEALSSTGPVLLTGQAGAVIDAGSILQAPDNRRYAVVANFEWVAAGQQPVTVSAVDAGKIGDVEAGTQMTLVSPVLGVTDTGTVDASGIIGGTDQESIESLRARVIRSYRVVPQGGAADDYVTWAGEVTGVTRAWCVRNYMGPGTVGLFVVRDGDVDPIPGAEFLALVKAYIEATRPVTADLYVLAPVPKPIAFQINPDPDTTQIRAAIENSLRDLLKREGDLGVTVLHTHLAEAISGSPGENDHQLVAPAGNVVLAPNEIPTFGGITWLV